MGCHLTLINTDKRNCTRSPKPYRRNQLNQSGFPGNTGGMFDPMMAMNMNMGMMNPLQFQLMTMQQAGMPRPQHPQQQKNFHHQQQQQQQQRPSESQAPPPGYVCHKCGQAGHWIYYCPNVPKGQYVPRQNNASQSAPIPALTEADLTPDELVCTICNELFRSASISLCCGKSFCEECIVNTLDKTHQCPHCGKSASSDQVVPNKTLRKIVGVFEEERQSLKETSHSTYRKQQETTNTDNDGSEGLDDSHKNGSDEIDMVISKQHNQQPESPPLDNQKLPNLHPQQINAHQQQQQQQQQNHTPFDSTDNNRGSHGRKQNVQGMDSMGRGFSGTPPAGMPFMANPTMFMGGSGAVPPFGFPDMSWMFGGNGAGNNSGGGRGGPFPAMNGMPMLPSFFGANNGAPIHYPGGFSGRGRGAGGKNSANTQQKQQQYTSRRQSDTTPYDPSNATGSTKAVDTSTHDSRSSSHRRHYQYDDDNASEIERHDSTRSKSHSRSSTSHHRDSRKRSRSRSHSPPERHSSSRRRHSNSSNSGHRKSRRTSRSPAAAAAPVPTPPTGTGTTKHYQDEGDDIVDYGDDDFEDEDEGEDEGDHHHRRHRRSSSSRHHRSGSSRRHYGSSSTRYRSSSRHRHSDDYRKNDRYRDSSRDRSYRRDKK
ncbi:unnamed protein product [Absidia cylindrospora]